LKLTRALDRGVFYASKMPKTHWRWCRGHNIFLWKWPAWYVLSNLLCKNMTPNALKCILLPQKYLKFVKNLLNAPITKVNEGESNTPCPIAH
jgi:hypothetical protein